MYIVSSDWTGEFKSCKVEESWSSDISSYHGFECLWFDLGGAKIGLDMSFTNYTLGASIHWLAKEANTESGLV